MAWINDHAIEQNVTKVYLKGLTVGNDHPLAVSKIKVNQKTKSIIIFKIMSEKLKLFSVKEKI